MTGSANNSGNRSLSVCSDEGGDSTSSESNDERNTTIGSASLRDELLAVNTMLSNLKAACPNRNNPARLSKNLQAQSKNDSLIPKIIAYLDTIHNLNTRIIDKIDELSAENTELRRMVADVGSPSYANVASGTTSSCGPALVCTSTKTETNPQATHANHLGPLPSDLQKISSRVDQLEQESLNCVLMLQGDSIKNVLTKVEHHSTPTTAAATTISTESSSSGERQVKLQQSAVLKRSVCDLLSPIVSNVSEDSITHVSVQGTHRKHLKVICNSTGVKQSILSCLKRIRPPGLFGNEYLTKIRSTLLYKVRLLKKQFPNNVTGYSRNGIVFCKMNNNVRPLMINDISEINKLEERLINGSSA